MSRLTIKALLTTKGKATLGYFENDTKSNVVVNHNTNIIKEYDNYLDAVENYNTLRAKR